MRYAMTVELPAGTVALRGNETPANRDDRVHAALTERLAPYNRKNAVEPYRDYITGTPQQYAPPGSTIRNNLGNRPLTWANLAAAQPEDTLEPLHLDDTGRPYTLTADNPNGEWDAWELGGSLHARFTLYEDTEPRYYIPASCEHPYPAACPRGGSAPGPHHTGRTDAAPHHAINWRVMRLEAAARAAAVHEGIANTVAAAGAKTWEQITSLYPDWTTRRQAFWSQTAIAENQEILHEFGLRDAARISEALGERESYVNQAHRGAPAGWAWLDIDGHWHARTARDDTDYLDRINARIDNPPTAVDILNVTIEP